MELLKKALVSESLCLDCGEAKLEVKELTLKHGLPDRAGAGSVPGGAPGRCPFFTELTDLGDVAPSFLTPE